ncbi:HK97 family phage prohead protease [Rubellimicrobium arenae]|uniref:HK97 family phage prohead protease n=1 Tax=Rubellimicrobium arenae TaxID=2817372 RepID=UPI001B305388|nr:phage major capsid protein [Rubellimicrobium arenae]
MTIVRKTETAEVSDDLTFVLSDGTVDRYGDVIEPEGWDLRWFKRNPIALFGHDNAFPIGNWANVRIESGKLLGQLKLADEGTSDRIDELIRLVRQKILKAVSVGFKPIEYEPLANGKGGLRYLKQELLETSLVTIPANPAALAVARALHISDDTMRLAFGEQAIRGVGQGRGTNGVNAATSPSQGTQTMTLAERIKALQDGIVQKRDQLLQLNQAQDLDLDAIDELNDQIETDEKALAGLKRSEQNLAARAAAVPNSGTGAVAPSVPAQARRPLGLHIGERKPVDLFFRAAACQIHAAMTGKDADEVRRLRYGDDEGTAMLVRAAVAGATTGAAGWAAELVNTVMTDFLETLRPASIYPELAAAGGGRLNFGPNQGAVKVPARTATPSIGGSFVGEGSPIPVRRLGLTSQTLGPKKMGVISVFSREIAKYSNPAIEALLRREITADTAITLDSVLLDANPATAVRPAGLLNGVTPLTATAGGGAAAVLGDIRKLRAPFDAVGAGQGLRLLMSEGQLESLQLTPGPDGTLGWAQGIIDRYDPITSSAIASGTLVMVRAADFVTVTGDAPEFDLSEETVLHMEDTSPAQIGATGTPNVVAAPVQSMFQTAQTAIRMLMDVNWAMVRTGMVQTITGATW